MNANWGILYQAKYLLPNALVEKSKLFSEFANGGAQATIMLKDKTIINEVLISNCKYVIAINGCDIMPFEIAEVADIFQTQDDIDNRDKTRWSCWKS